MPSTPCHRHPEVSATRSCGECFQPICAGCAVIEGGDQTRAVQYAQTLFSAEDWRGSLQFSDDFVTRCGKFPQLRSISYSAHIRLSEFDLAVRDATELSVLKEHQRANVDSSRRLDVVERVALLEAEGHCGASGDKTKVPAGKPGKR
jgi:hypothetical protein